jgi:hypothetical protein
MFTSFTAVLREALIGVAARQVATGPVAARL